MFGSSFFSACYSVVKNNTLRLFSEPTPENTPLLANSAAVINSEENLSFWKYASKLDLLRRFLLSGSKLLNWVSLFTFLLETYYLLDITQSSQLGFAIFMISSFFIGGTIEFTLAFFPRYNQKILPVWNGVFQITENLLLKLASITLFVCPPVDIGHNQYQSLRACVDQYGKILMACIPVLLIPSFIAGYAEYRKYQLVKTESRRILCCRSLCCRFFSAESTGFKMVFTFINSIVSGLSLVTAMDYSTYVFTGKAFLSAPIYIAILVPYGILSACIEFLNSYKQKPLFEKASKAVYFFDEFIRPSAGNWHAGDHLVFSFASLIYGDYNGGIAGRDRIFLINAIVLFLNALRVHDAYRYKYTYHQLFPPIRQTNQEITEDTTAESGLQNVV